jgi:hypothetical protein
MCVWAYVCSFSSRAKSPRDVCCCCYTTVHAYTCIVTKGFNAVNQPTHTNRVKLARHWHKEQAEQARAGANRLGIEKLSLVVLIIISYNAAAVKQSFTWLQLPQLPALHLQYYKLYNKACPTLF